MCIIILDLSTTFELDQYTIKTDIYSIIGKKKKKKPGNTYTQTNTQTETDTLSIYHLGSSKYSRFISNKKNSENADTSTSVTFDLEM